MKNYIVLLYFFLPSSIIAQTFTDVAALQNIYETYSPTSNYGGGISFYDIDNDGWDDLTFVSPNDSLKIYKNNQGVFTSISSSIYISGQTKQALWVDYDNDGDNDLCISVDNGPCKLYKNNGNLFFTDVTILSGMPFASGANYSVAFGDYNKDGFLDLLIGRYSYSPVTTNNLEKNALYKNNGNGTFSDVTLASGIDIGLTQTFEAVWLDYNKDGWPDIYTATDRYDYDNALFENNGDGTFTNVALAVGAAAVNVNAMTATFGDFDNDIDLDIYMTNIGGSDSSKLLVSNVNHTFSELGAQFGVANTQFTWGASWIDADNDGFLDLLVAADSLTADSRTYLFMNNAGLGFVDSPQNFQSNNSADSRSVANGDINNDGKIDVVVCNTSGYNSFLWQNTSIINNYIKITLHGTISNRMAIGSWINVYAGGQSYSHYTRCGENLMGQNSQHYIFGLAQHQIVDSVVVTYLSGVRDRYLNLAVNQSYDFTESGSIINHLISFDDLSFCEGDSVVLDAGNFTTFLWSTGYTQRYLPVFMSGYYSVIVTDSLGATMYSDSLFVFVESLPQISINATNLTCFNSLNGMIELEIINQTSNFSVSWNQGLQGTTLMFLYPDNYIYHYTDTFGCSVTDSITITAPFAINVQTSITPFSTISMGIIQSVINGGTPPYAIYLNGVIASNHIDSLQPGIYNFQVIDANGCQYTTSIEILDLTITSDYANSWEPILYPNPCIENFIQIHASYTITSIAVYDMLGNKIITDFQNNKLFIQASYRGMLHIEVTTEDKTFWYKLIKL